MLAVYPTTGHGGHRGKMTRHKKKSSQSRRKVKAKKPTTKPRATPRKPAKKSPARKGTKPRPAARKTPKKAAPAKKRPGRKKPSYQKRVVKATTKATTKTVKRSQRKISAQLRAFRRALGKLKRAGVVPAKTNVKTAKPTKRTTKLLKDFKPVIDGKATALKLSKKTWQRHYKQQGHVVRQGFVLLDNIPGHKYSKDDRGIKTTRLEGRYETIELPIDAKKLERFLHEIEFNKNLEKLKQPGERWAFRFFGNNSRRVFTTLRQLIDYVSQYQVIDQGLQNKGYYKNELIKALEIVRVNDTVGNERWRQMPDKRRDFKAANKEYKKRMNAKGRNEPNKDRHRPNRWQRLKETRPLQYQDALRKGRIRIAKWRKAKKRKSK